MDTPAEEIDLQLAEVREINGSMLEELRVLAEEAPGVDVAATLREVGLQLPRPPVGSRGGGLTGSRTPSRTSSVTSETSSVRSARARGTVQIR
jgi:hypothetical protein